MNFRRTTIRRIVHLDSLRGFAALAVVLNHCYLALPGPKDYHYLLLLSRYPVIFFFLLSGFVLSSSLVAKRDISSGARFIIQRLFRLYPPALFSKLFAYILLISIAFPLGMGLVSDDFRSWLEQVESVKTSGQFLLEALLVHQHLNIVVWTIQVEVLCSCTLPFFVYLVVRWPLLHIPLLVLFAVILQISQPIPYDHVAPRIGYMFAFLLGFWVYRKLSWLEKLGQFTSFLLVILALICLWFVVFHSERHLLVIDCLVTGVLFAVLVPCNMPVVNSVLHTPFLRLIGKLSFSLYLIHFPVLLYISGPFIAYHQTGNQHLDTFILFIVTTALTLGISLITERWIERPSNQFGKWLANRIISKKAITEHG